MQKLALTTTLLLLATTLPSLAAANIPHDECTSKTITTVGHVDLYGKPCAGVVARPSVTTCPTRDFHVIEGVHILVLDGPGCGVGVIVELP